MKRILGFLSLIALIAISCSSIDFTEQRSENFRSNYEFVGFRLFVNDMLKEEGYSVVALDSTKGFIRAAKSVDSESNIDLFINFELENNEVSINVVNKINSPDGIRTEYYNLSEYNPEYKEHFHKLLEGIINNSIKTAFPNR
ncbi:MAG: hypothetical protein WCZ17_00970 [Candidatus Kapaibacterium sp.]|jgi:hypothetical protein|nr:hypothetical protein [Candidatus Kapabacteria bacterium]